jgi:hypothetical protein
MNKFDKAIRHSAKAAAEWLQQHLILYDHGREFEEDLQISIGEATVSKEVMTLRARWGKF